MEAKAPFSYDPSKTVEAKARVWLRPVHQNLQSAPSEVNSAFSEPRHMSWDMLLTVELKLTDGPGNKLQPRVEGDRVFYRMLDAKNNASVFMVDLKGRMP